VSEKWDSVFFRFLRHDKDNGMDVLAELRKRGMVHQMAEGTEERLQKGRITFYIGIDPTAPSLHIGNLASLMPVYHFLKAGHQVIFVIGGATALIGDPSGKTAERPLLPPETIQQYKIRIEQQLQQLFHAYLDQVKIMDNMVWLKDILLIDFLRVIGKHVTLNYMLAKESVKSRMETGISFTEFCYQLLQGYDFYHLYRVMDCELQIGGSDQWGNITTGILLIERLLNKQAYGLTVPLLTKADGTKFGKTEEGAIWLDKRLTSPYQFYQFWINLSDRDAERIFPIFSLRSLSEIADLIQEARKTPEQRVIQKALAHELTLRIHGEEELKMVEKAVSIFFHQDPVETLKQLKEEEVLTIFQEIPHYECSKVDFSANSTIVDILVKAGIFSSKGEVKRLIQSGGLYLNQERVVDEQMKLHPDSLIAGKFLLVRQGKKQYALIHFV